MVNLEKLITCLANHQVEFVVIGGVAATVYS